jgi:hypothetical protein
MIETPLVNDLNIALVMIFEESELRADVPPFP